MHHADIADAPYWFWGHSYRRTMLVLVPVPMHDTGTDISSICFNAGIGGISIRANASFWHWYFTIST